MVKTELGPEKICLERERSNYKLPAVVSCQHIRTLHDVVGPDGDGIRAKSTSRTEDPPCLVFEWMEHDLRTVSPDQFRQNSNLPKIIAKSVLLALVLLKTQYGAVHTGEFILSFRL
jgi:hypothetical protein